MNNQKTIRGEIMLIIYFLSCTSELDDKTAASVTDKNPKTTVETQEKTPSKKDDQIKLDPSSKVEWVGSKVSGDHRGGFQKISGTVSLIGEGEHLKIDTLQASFDINSLYSDSDKLTQHLLQADFFDAEKFPTSNFTMKNYEKDTMTGVLQLRGVEKEISFPCIVTVDKKQANIKAEFTINRKDFGIIYAGRADDLIRDEVLLKLDITYK